MADVYTLGNVGGISKTLLWDGDIASIGNYTLNDSVNNYKMIVVEHYLLYQGVKYFQSLIIASIYTDPNNIYVVCHGNSSNDSSLDFYFSTDGMTLIVKESFGEIISKIYGIN